LNPSSTENIYKFYASQGIVTQPGEYAFTLDNLPTDIALICQLIQGFMIHGHWLDRYKALIPKDRQESEMNLRTVRRQLARIQELDNRPLTIPRLNDNKLVGTCRDFATIMAAILRHQGIPARARCGFGLYFMPGHYEDHWVCEYWQASENRWIMADAQIDLFQKDILGVQFDTTDMPPGMFITGGQAWQLCRSGKADPEIFGIFEYHGLDFIAANVVRDILALNKIEILPWDDWPLIKNLKDFTPEHFQLIDSIAETTLAKDNSIEHVRSIYENTPALQPSADWQP
jgi:hypothetical protein